MRRLLPAFALALLAGCNAGPDYEPPELQAPVQFANANAPEYGDGVPDSSVWHSFSDPALSALLNAALVNNTDVGVALARLDESRALSGLSIYTYFPTVTAQGNQVRATQSSVDPFGFPVDGVIERYSVSFDATWEIDLFGSLRRQLEQIEAIVESDAASLNQVRLSVMGDVAQSYFTLRGTSAQLQVQRENVAAQARSVEILEASLNAGRGTALDVAQARSLERSLAAAIPNTEAAVARAEQRLLVLTSLSIDELRELLGAGGALPAIPARIELGQPDEWLRRRPDVQTVERQLAAASAAIGVEAANYWPRVDLVGSFGWNSQSLSDIGSAAAEVWSAGPAISWRFLDVGRVRQRVMAAEAQERQAFETFRGTVQLALEEMENSLANFRAANRVVIALEQALAESTTASDLSSLRFDTGRSSYLEVLDAERTRLGLVDQLAAARTNQATALIAVYKALAAY
ncbi:MAG: TolC family protein [Pseudomonadota bacterium]